MIPYNFFKRNQNVLDFSGSNFGFFCNGHGKGKVVNLRNDNEGIYMIHGDMVADVMGIKTPTKAKIEHEGGRNMFFVTFLTDEDVPNIPEKVQKETVYISSDDEANVTYEDDVDHNQLEHIQDLNQMQEVNEVEQVPELQHVQEVQQVEVVQELEQEHEVEEMNEYDVHVHFQQNVTAAMCNLRKPQCLVHHINFIFTSNLLKNFNRHNYLYIYLLYCNYF